MLVTESVGVALLTTKFCEPVTIEGEAVTVIPDVVPAGVVLAVVIVNVTLITVVLPAGRVTGFVDQEGVAPLGNEVPVRDNVVLPATAPPFGVIATL